MTKKWNSKEVLELFKKPLLDLVFEAATTHREFHDPNQIQVSGLVSIKTGACPEDCAYCPQSARFQTEVTPQKMLSLEEMVSAAVRLKEKGATRICLGAAWKNAAAGKDFETVCEAVREINKLDVEVCCTLGMLNESQARLLEAAGLYAYNHNIDTSPGFYPEIISTRTFEDRIKTLETVRKTNITVCSGGIIGMGESLEDRAVMLTTLANLNPPPESVPINALVPVKGTPLESQDKVDPLHVVRTVSVARILMPKSVIRLSAGRLEMSYAEQGFCFLAGANSIFSGEKLLTTPNPDADSDAKLFDVLNLNRRLSTSPHEPVAKSVKDKIYNQLEQAKTRGTYRVLSIKTDLIDFSSNDYLGLSKNGLLQRQIEDSSDYKKLQTVGATGSRLLNGNSGELEHLEEKIRIHHRASQAVLFNSGYDANLGLFSSLPKEDTRIFYDELVHASVKDGIKLWGGYSQPFRHNDLGHLENRLKTSQGATFIAVESLYSMNGDFSPLIEIADLCRKFKASLIVDEAHTGGLFGKDGAGLVEELGLQEVVFARVMTYGKAFGCQGASILCSKLFKEHLINFSHPFIYSTAPSLITTQAISCAYELIQEQAGLQDLQRNQIFFNKCITDLRIENIQGHDRSPIKWLPLSKEKLMAVAEKFEQLGFDVRSIRSPTVKRGTERLRIVLHSFNTESEIERLCKALVTVA